MQTLALLLEILGVIGFFAIACYWSDVHYRRGECTANSMTIDTPPSHSLPLAD